MEYINFRCSPFYINNAIINLSQTFSALHCARKRSQKIQKTPRVHLLNKKYFILYYFVLIKELGNKIFEFWNN